MARDHEAERGCSRGRGRLRIACGAVLALVASTLVVAPSGAIAGLPVACEEVQQRGSWTSVTHIPGWQTGNENAPDSPAAWAIHPTDPNRIYVLVPDLGLYDEVQPGIMEGSLIRSTDRGCSWEEVLTEDDLNVPLAGATKDPWSPRWIDNVGVGPDGTVYVSVFVAQRWNTSGRLQSWGNLESVWISRDGGDKWERTTEGLPVATDAPSVDAVDTKVTFFPAPSDPETVYLLGGNTNNGGANTDLYASTNGGRSWEARSVYTREHRIKRTTYVDDCVYYHPAVPPQGPCTDNGISGDYRSAPYFNSRHDLVVDPLNPSELWGLVQQGETEAERNERWRDRGTPWGSSDPKLVHSTNGGKDWVRIPLKGYKFNHTEFSAPSWMGLFRNAGGPPYLYVAAEYERVAVPEDQVCFGCARTHERYTLLRTTDEGKTWEVVAKVTTRSDGTQFPLYLAFGSRADNVVIGDVGKLAPFGPDGFRVHVYNRRTKTWSEARPVHLDDNSDGGDHKAAAALPDFRMTREGNSFYLVTPLEWYKQETGFQVSLEMFQLPRY